LLIDPNNDASALLVFERTDNDENEINKRPDAQAAQSDYLKYSGANLTDVNRCTPNIPKNQHNRRAARPLLGLAPAGQTFTPVGAPQCGHAGAKLEMICPQLGQNC
jgi:hypothetical protein